MNPISSPRRIDRRIHGDVVEVLADGACIIGQYDVAVMEVAGPIKVEPVLHRSAHDIGDEDRHAGRALANQIAVRIDDADRVILILVNIGAERGPRDVDVDLIGDRDKSAPDHFDGDRVDGCQHGILAAKRVNGGSQCESLRERRS